MEITLNKNGWHSKIQKYVFRSSTPRFYNFCPYFWLTLFCIPASIVIFILRTLMGAFLIISNVFNKMADLFEKIICVPAFEKSAINMNNEDLLLSWSFGKYSNNDWAEYEFWSGKYFKGNSIKTKKREVLEKKFEIWKSKNPNWQQILTEVKEKHRKEYLDIQAKNDKIREEQYIKDVEKVKRVRERKQKMFINIIKYTKWFAIIAVALFTIKLIYWIYLLCLYIADHFYWDKFVILCKNVSLFLIIFLVVYGVMKLISIFWKKITCRFECKLCKYVGKFLAAIGNSFLWLLRKIGNVFYFFWIYLITVKKNYCPGIEWIEER